MRCVCDVTRQSPVCCFLLLFILKSLQYSNLKNSETNTLTSQSSIRGGFNKQPNKNQNTDNRELLHKELNITPQKRKKKRRRRNSFMDHWKEKHHQKQTTNRQNNTWTYPYVKWIILYMEVAKTASCEYWFELNGDVLGVKIRRDHLKLMDITTTQVSVSGLRWLSKLVVTFCRLFCCLLPLNLIPWWLPGWSCDPWAVSGTAPPSPPTLPGVKLNYGSSTLRSSGDNEL